MTENSARSPFPRLAMVQFCESAGKQLGPEFCEIDARAGLLQQLFVFGNRRGISNRVVNDASRSGASARALLGGWRSSSLEMTFLCTLLESLQSLLLGGRHDFGV